MPPSRQLARHGSLDAARGLRGGHESGARVFLTHPTAAEAVTERYGWERV